MGYFPNTWGAKPLEREIYKKQPLLVFLCWLDWFCFILVFTTLLLFSIELLDYQLRYLLVYKLMVLVNFYLKRPISLHHALLKFNIQVDAIVCSIYSGCHLCSCTINWGWGMGCNSISLSLTFQYYVSIAWWQQKCWLHVIKEKGHVSARDNCDKCFAMSLLTCCLLFFVAISMWQ